MNVNSRYKALMQRLGWTSDGTPEALMLLELVSSAEEFRSAVAAHADSLQHDLDRVRKALEPEFANLNERGEFQARPAAVEAAVGAYVAANRMLRMFLVTYGLKEI
jgi:hypothetical protein